MTGKWLSAGGVALLGLLISTVAGAAADTLTGTVTSSAGPEAGVWVIAETRELKSRFVKIVVTDDRGRFVVPDLPTATYKVWTRGYGLLDTKSVKAKPGQELTLTATVAPDAHAAAQVYPASYWYSLLIPPADSEFPGTGAKGNGIAPVMLSQQHWLENMKENCMFCHQLGGRPTREMVDTGNSVQGWANRTQMARADGDLAIVNNGSVFAATMQNNLAWFGRDRALKMFADWTDRIAAGQVPSESPPRPQGYERNIVLTIRDWGQGHFIHDQISSDHRNPNVNAGGPIYGMGMLHGLLEVIDPKTLETWNVPVPGIAPATPHNPETRIHADEMDGKGRVWMPTVSTDGPAPAYCTDGSSPYSKYFPLKHVTQATPLVMYDPATKKIIAIPMCIGGNHSNFSFDASNTLYMSHDTQAVGWINTRLWDETHDAKQSTGWCPMVLDTNGDGKIDPDHNQWSISPDPFGGGEESMAKADDHDAHLAAKAKYVMDPKKDTLFKAYLYGMSVAKDGGVWLAAYAPYVPSAIVHLMPGKHPPTTCKTEVFQPPLKDGKYLAYGVRGVGVDSSGIAWAALSSGQVGRFDRKQCKVTRGPTATGQQCPEGWTFYDLPGPKVAGTTTNGDFVYSGWIDYENVMGLGKETVFFPAVNSDSVMALPPGATKFVVFRVPYPMGFYTRGLDFRIDDPKAGWKGKTLQATYSGGVLWHDEDGEGSSSKIVTFQVRPNPLAH